MKFKKLGKSDISVSEICLGSMTWGEQNTQKEAIEQLDYAFSRGVNFIDTAEMYPVAPSLETTGRTEEYIGHWDKIKTQRDKIILATKIAGPGMETVRQGKSYFSSENIREAINGSLKRLQTDYIDLYQLHWPERQTNFFGQLGYIHSDENQGRNSFREILSILQELQKEGKIRLIGISNETAWGAMEWLKLSERLELPRMSTIQNPYNLLNRSFEVGLAEVTHREDLGLLAYSPMAFGMLSGKYRNNQKPKNCRLTLWDRFGRYLNPQSLKAIDKYCDLAESHNLTPATMSLSFVNSRSFVASNIIGATNLDQLKENIDSVDVELKNEVLEEIENIHREFSNPAP